MEPSSKRRKTAKRRTDVEEEEDELFLEPEELNQRRDPAYQLQKGRALAVNKLKHRFEDIFAKYERDFTGIGDEIDLRTGEIVVDNGHLESMTMHQDSDDSGEDDGDGNGNVSEDANRFPQGVVHNGSSTDASLTASHRDRWQVPGSGWPPPGAVQTPGLSSTMYREQQSLMSPFFSTPPFGTSTPMGLDPAWQVPELPAPSFVDHSSNAHGQNRQSTIRKVVRKSLPIPEDVGEEEEDVLLRVSGNVRKTQVSPLIKERFPVISSPQEDPSLSEFINEVIQENLQESSPSNRVEKASQTSVPTRKPKRQLRHMGPGPEKKSTKGRLQHSKNKATADQTHESSVNNNMSNLGPDSKEVNTLETHYGRIENHEPNPSEATESRSASRQHSILYVEIRAAKVDNNFLPVQDKSDFVKETEQKGTKAPSRKPIAQRTMERIAVDASFNVSDDDTLPPKRTRGRRQAEPVNTAVVAPTNDVSSEVQSKLRAQPMERNVVDPTFAFSDEDNMPPRSSRRKARLSEPAPSLSKDTTTGRKALGKKSRDIQAEQPKALMCTKPETSITAPESQPSPADATKADAAAVKDHAEPNPEKPVQLNDLASLSSNRQLALQGEDKPTTPHRPKSKKPKSKSAQATNSNLISLLSDEEDEEDEISFNLADFTPSGHHRILVHRPFPAGFTNPPTLSSFSHKFPKKQRKKSRTSLFPSWKESVSYDNDNKTPSTKDRKRKSHQRLPRSVVKVGREGRSVSRRSGRLPSPTGSIVQTPGGTKRRCGEGEFRCERDFCFLCL